MALNTFTPPNRQSSGTKIKSVPKKLQADFGDGYSQISPDGIHNIRQTADLTWDPLLPDDALAIDQFFAAQNLAPFLYDVDEGDVRRWICDTWERGRNTDGHTVTATFTEYFGPIV